MECSPLLQKSQRKGYNGILSVKGFRIMPKKLLTFAFLWHHSDLFAFAFGSCLPFLDAAFFILLILKRENITSVSLQQYPPPK